VKFERRAREQRGQPLGALVGGLLVASAALAALWLRLGLPLPQCQFRELTGIACPTCGSSRLVESLLSGRILEAAAMNPFIFAGLTAVVLWAVISTARLVFRLPTWRLVLTKWERRALVLLLVGAVLTSWAYIIWRDA
jgi:hypothetical protein